VTETAGGGWVETERRGHLVRHFPVALSAGALALAWARQEDAPSGAAVLADREVSPRGRHGLLWETDQARSLLAAVVVRPDLAATDADITWLVASLAALRAVEDLGGTDLGLQALWPDQVVTASGAPVATVKAETQLGPGRVRSAVLSIRIDLDAAGLEPDRRHDLLDALLVWCEVFTTELGTDPTAAAAAYLARCGLVGKRIKVALLPKGETRGTVRSFDRSGRVELESATGMVERVNVDALRSYEVT
jgi:BirA family transcriptional regulator, biotin operon repressor / biotin---[acetyl-CoA-carboxylase] ligase